MVKTIKKEKRLLLPIPANKDYKPLKVTAENELIIWE